MTNLHSDSLFGDFSAVSHAEWKAKVLGDLKGAAFDSLLWKTPDGFAMEPWYNNEEGAAFPAVPTGGTSNSWRICQLIAVNDPEEANLAARDALHKGADTLEFRLTDPLHCSAASIAVLLSDIDLASVPVYFSGSAASSQGLLDHLLALPGFDKNSGGILRTLSSGEELPTLSEAPADFRLCAVNTEAAHLAGATPALEIAIALSGLSDTLSLLAEKGIAAESAAPKIELVMAAGSSHFIELAKIRALKLLWPAVLGAFGVEAASTTAPRIFTRSSERNTSLLDPYTNILRLTTEAVSSILGGTDTLQLGSFDPGATVAGDVAERITRNIHLILREESGLDRVIDPAAGSFYIETLTGKLCIEAWKFFLQIENGGGTSAAVESGLLGKMIAAAAETKKEKVRKRKNSLIGVNRYAGAPAPEVEAMLPRLSEETTVRIGQNDAAEFEQLRINALQYTRRNGPMPPVYLWLHGDRSKSFRVAAFAEDFFRCGGFPVEGSQTLELEADSCRTALQQGPKILVLCWTGKDDLAVAPALFRTLRELDSKLVIVIAGKPPKETGELYEAGLDGFIHSDLDAFEALLSFQTKTGVL